MIIFLIIVFAVSLVAMFMFAVDGDNVVAPAAIRSFGLLAVASIISAAALTITENLT